MHLQLTVFSRPKLFVQYAKTKFNVTSPEFLIVIKTADQHFDGGVI